MLAKKSIIFLYSWKNGPYTRIAKLKTCVGLMARRQPLPRIMIILESVIVHIFFPKDCLYSRHQTYQGKCPK